MFAHIMYAYIWIIYKLELDSNQFAMHIIRWKMLPIFVAVAGQSALTSWGPPVIFVGLVSPMNELVCYIPHKP